MQIRSRFRRRPAAAGVLAPVASLRPEEAAAFAGRCTVITIPATDKICRQGRTGNELFFLLEGHATVVRNGREVATIGPGSVVGERSMLGMRVYQDATVIASTDVVAAVVSRREFTDAVGEQPSLRTTLQSIADSR